MVQIKFISIRKGRRKVKETETEGEKERENYQQDERSLKKVFVKFNWLFAHIALHQFQLKL